MSKDTNSTRRSFLKHGAVLAAPIVAATPAAVLADDGLKARLVRLENEVAIRALHQTWLRQFSSGSGAVAMALFADTKNAGLDQTVRNIVADHTGEPDTIEIAADGKSASGRFQCAVDIVTAIPQDCTLAQMAHAQGGGFVRRTERRILKVNYTKAGGAWAIAKAELAEV
ncbi:MAG TPA: hypothetical protein VEJ38_12595 [Candidatus Acidoferrales bacterium]|nr:hypothetical protein [Candidatus Acidoferrales bacterium]